MFGWTQHKELSWCMWLDLVSGVELVARSRTLDCTFRLTLQRIQPTDNPTTVVQPAGLEGWAPLLYTFLIFYKKSKLYLQKNTNCNIFFNGLPNICNNGFRTFLYSHYQDVPEWSVGQIARNTDSKNAFKIQYNLEALQVTSGEADLAINSNTAIIFLLNLQSGIVGHILLSQLQMHIHVCTYVSNLQSQHKPQGWNPDSLVAMAKIPLTAVGPEFIPRCAQTMSIWLWECFVCGQIHHLSCTVFQP